MNKRGQLAFGIMAIFSAVLLIAVIFITVIATDVDFGKTAALSFHGISSTSDDPLLLSFLKSPANKNFNFADLISHSFDDVASFSLLDKEIHRLFDSTGRYYFFTFEYAGGVKEVSSSLTPLDNPVTGTIDLRLSHISIPSHKGEIISIRFMSAEALS